MRGPQIARLPQLRREAEFSPDGIYRYTLTRTWGESSGILNMIMLNPSKADTEQDDNTIRKVMGFADHEGFQRVIITNLFGLRSTDPKGLWNIADPVGPGNDYAIRESARQADEVWVGWGSWNIATIRRSLHVQELLHSVGVKEVWCFAVNSNGSPKHPLYVAYSTLMTKWPGYY